jgi:hypothetical protein
MQQPTGNAKIGEQPIAVFLIARVESSRSGRWGN